MVVFPGCKINIGLNITGKRADGFHEIESVFYPLNLSDILEIVENDHFALEMSGLPINGSQTDNLVVKAYQLLADHYDLPPVKIALHKIVPMGAGLGGGSADGAAALVVLNKLFNLNIQTEKLEVLADQLGSDCAFFIKNKAAYVRGKGEIVKPINLDLSAYYIQLVNPGIHISTKEAFQGITIGEMQSNLVELLNEAPTNWRQNVCNAFEPNIMQNHPEIAQIKTNLLINGAEYVAMTGTGSSVYGIFKSKPAPIHPQYFEWISQL